MAARSTRLVAVIRAAAAVAAAAVAAAAVAAAAVAAAAVAAPFARSLDSPPRSTRPNKRQRESASAGERRSARNLRLQLAGDAKGQKGECKTRL